MILLKKYLYTLTSLITIMKKNKKEILSMTHFKIEISFISH